MIENGMISFTSHPRAINGVFTVAKDEQSDRLIIDAQPANRCFVDSPDVLLPDPSHLLQLQIPPNTELYTGKTDLSNYYHQLGLPEWMQPFFCLPPLTPDELRSLGISADTTCCYPMCLTLPMGFSHAVYIAQSVHEWVLYQSEAVHPQDNILRLQVPLSRSQAAKVIHGIYIDDFFHFSLSQPAALVVHHRVLAAYAAAGFVVKPSKVIAPTAGPVKVLGIQICGASAALSIPVASQLQLIASTLAVLRVRRISGLRLSRLIGSWTWCLLLRRPALSILHRVYRFMHGAGQRRFEVWPTVRLELKMLLGTLPLLFSRLDAPTFHRVACTDASEIGVGVVTCPLIPSRLSTLLWSSCASRAAARAPLAALALPVPHGDLVLADTLALHHEVLGSHWSTIISKRWVHEEHINVLELRAVLLLLHWLLSYPSALGSRVFCLVDSAVAFFTLWKGRSSSPALLFVMRKISALLLASDITLLCGWIPSAVNPADHPSRSC
jgi:hypothetical protein